MRENRLGITSLALGILGLLFACIIGMWLLDVMGIHLPCNIDVTSFIAVTVVVCVVFVPCVVSIIMGIVAMMDYLTYKWTSIMGMVLSVMGMLIFIFVFVLIVYRTDVVVQ